MATSYHSKNNSITPFRGSLLKAAASVEPQQPGIGKGKDGMRRTIAAKIVPIVASKIVGATCSPLDISGWIHDYLTRYQPYNKAPELIKDASKASQIVSGDAFNSGTKITRYCFASLQFTLPLTASAAVTNPSPGEKTVGDMSKKERKRVENMLASICFTLFDTNRDGYLNTDDIKTLIKVYGLEGTTFASGTLSSTADVRVSKEVFKSWLISNKINLLSVRYPFKLLQLVSYCFRHESFLDPSDMTFYMDVIFASTFGEKVKLETGMFGHIGHLEYLYDPDEGSGYLPVEDFEALLRLWGVTQKDTEDIVDKLRLSRIRNIPYRDMYGIFNDLPGGSRVPLQVSDFFVLLDRDKDGCLSPGEIAQFAARFSQELSEDQIDAVIKSFDLDKDGHIGLEDFCLAMSPVLKGTSWEVWLVAIAWAFLLVANPSILLN